MENRFADIRVETIKTFDNFVERLKHNTRYKKDKRVVNGLGIIAKDAGQVIGFNNEYSKKIVKRFDKIFYETTLNEVKQLNKDFREKRHALLGEGILYFSEGINEDWWKEPTEFRKRLEELLAKFEERNNTEVLTWQIHTDEAGNVHVHFMFKNFDKTNGKSLNFTRSKKNGEWLQDLAFKHFESFGKGYRRGIKKERTEKHLSIEEFKELEESKKLLSEAQEQLKNTQSELKHTKALLNENNAKNRKLEQINQDLNEKASKMRKELLFLVAEMDSIMDDFEDFLLSENDKEKLEKLKRLFIRHSKNENKERMIKSIEKGRKLSKSFKSKYTRKNIR